MRLFKQKAAKPASFPTSTIHDASPSPLAVIFLEMKNRDHERRRSITHFKSAVGKFYVISIAIFCFVAFLGVYLGSLRVSSIMSSSITYQTYVLSQNTNVSLINVTTGVNISIIVYLSSTSLGVKDMGTVDVKLIVSNCTVAEDSGYTNS